MPALKENHVILAKEIAIEIPIAKLGSNVDKEMHSSNYQVLLDSKNLKAEKEKTAMEMATTATTQISIRKLPNAIATGLIQLQSKLNTKVIVLAPKALHVILEKVTATVIKTANMA